VHLLGSEKRCHHEGVGPRLWNVVRVIRLVVRDGLNHRRYEGTASSVW
jgi:hypothetical protein